MEYSDDKTIGDGKTTAVATENTKSVDSDADGISAPLTDTAEREAPCAAARSDMSGEPVSANGSACENLDMSKSEQINNTSNNTADGKNRRGSSVGKTSAANAENASASFGDELIGIAVKSVAVVLSVILIIVCILAVALPLPAMRIFNSLGMSERAVDFGERYIARELGDHYGVYEYTDGNNFVRTARADASHTDGRGNFDILAKTPALTNDEFIEALYVCTKLSYDIMEECYALGDTARGAYYAERVEKYTRMYLSLNNVATVNNSKSLRN
ncbi:MAG: hypothetical protein K2L54_03900, partial [Clostridiales bacterium]|nr:hypothetical protein [Clostridiales bacterium]